jgi:glycosyltransferase involved in cell wall biosynthesis
MQIHIIFDIKKLPTGGGNQFLKALKKYFIAKDIYSENPDGADVFLFNSYQYIPQVIQLKKKYSNKIFVHRVDGPIRLYSQMSDMRDDIINTTNKYIADATIFQSYWSKEHNLELGLGHNIFETVITNASDNNVFNTINKSGFKNSGKIKLIATSWSSSYKKGFAVYKWLDDHLDFSKYEMTFCGNSPIEFTNIRHIQPLSSNDLAKELKKHHIFITASQKDPCSNSLIEALHCGLPVVALNDGGHPEIVKSAGEIFNRVEEIPELLEKISSNFKNYFKKINYPDINQVAEKYLLFFKNILHGRTKKTKKLTWLNEFKIRYLLIKLKMKSEIRKYL